MTLEEIGKELKKVYTNARLAKNAKKRWPRIRDEVNAKRRGRYVNRGTIE